jgi:hypothetical protein
MKRNLGWLTAVVAIGSALVAVDSAMAAVTIDNFQNFNANALYASWATPAAVIAQKPIGWEVASVGYGSLWKYEGDVNGSGMTQVQLTLDITGDPGFVAGPIVDLIDNNGFWATFAWYGITTPGTHVLTADLSTKPGLNIADIQHIHLECDPGSAPTLTYDLTFRDLSLVATVPEPASLTLLALGALGLVIARRRAR